jgi:hypothetical protein
MEQYKAGTFKFIENYKIQRVNKETKEIIDTEEFSNLITNVGLTRVALLLNGNSSTYFRALAVGTGVTAAANTDTALQTEVTRSAATLTNGTYTSIFEHTFTFGSAYAITEAGIFDSATLSGSTMLSRTVFAAKNVSAAIQLIVTATITVARV